VGLARAHRIPQEMQNSTKFDLVARTQEISWVCGAFPDNSPPLDLNEAWLSPLDKLLKLQLEIFDFAVLLAKGVARPSDEGGRR
jgi:hypothetical protein